MRGEMVGACVPRARMLWGAAILAASGGPRSVAAARWGEASRRAAVARPIGEATLLSLPALARPSAEAARVPLPRGGRIGRAALRRGLPHPARKTSIFKIPA